MSFAFILYCVWVAACVAIEQAPQVRRPQLRFMALVAGAVPVTLALFTVGFAPAMFGLGGIIVLFPAPFAALSRIAMARAEPIIARMRQRIIAWRDAHHA